LLSSREIAQLVNTIPSAGIGTLPVASGKSLSEMYVRSEQLEFLLELRKYISNASYIGPFILALSRCGSAVDIWRMWESVRGENLEDGVITTFVEGFILAKDLLSAMEFIKVASTCGYPLNFPRARAIAAGIEFGQWRIASDLVRELVVQTVKLDQEQAKEIISLLRSSIRRTSLSADSESLREPTGYLTGVIRSAGGADMYETMEELEWILDRLGRKDSK